MINNIRKNRTDLQQSSDYINHQGQKRIKTVTVKYKTEREPLQMENITLNSLDTDDDDVLKFEFIPGSDNDEFSSNIKSEDEQSQSVTDLDTKSYSVQNPTDKIMLEPSECIPPSEYIPVLTENNFVPTKTETASSNIIENDPKNNIHMNTLYESDDNRSNDVNFDIDLEATPKQNKKELRSPIKSKRPTRKSTRNNKNLFQPDNDYSNSSDANFELDLDIAHENETETDNEDTKSKRGRRTNRKSAKTNLKKDIKDKDSDHKFVGIIRQPKGELSEGNWETKLLTDEEAMEQFKKKEFDSRYERMEFKCIKCFKGFSKNEMLLRHNKLWHDHVSIFDDASLL